MPEKTKIILRNDPAKNRIKKNPKNRQQLNFSINNSLHLDVKELHLREIKRRNKRFGKRFNLSEFYEMVIAKGVKEWLNR